MGASFRQEAAPETQGAMTQISEPIFADFVQFVENECNACIYFFA
jgi:hypothetical protein